MEGELSPKRPVLLVLPTMDVESQFAREGDLAQLPTVKIDVREDRLLVKIVGSSKRRQVVSISLSAQNCIEGGDGHAVMRWAEPFGSDAVASFELEPGLSELPIVHVSWEQPVQIGLRGPDEGTGADVAMIWTDDEDGDELDLLLEEKAVNQLGGKP